MKYELESKYQCQSSALSHDQKHIKDVTVNLESTLDDINVLKGRIIDTKVFLKIQDILKNIDECKTNVSTLNQTTTRRMLNFVPDKTMNNFFSSSFTMGTISLEQTKNDVTISVHFRLSYQTIARFSSRVPIVRKHKTNFGDKGPETHRV